MKKILVFVVIFSAFCYYMSVSEEHKKQGAQAESLFAKATTADGRLDLSILFASNLLPEERREAYEEADRDGDGFLTQEEYDALPETASKYAKELAERIAENAPANNRFELCSAPFVQPYAEKFAAIPQDCSLYVKSWKNDQDGNFKADSFNKEANVEHDKELHDIESEIYCRLMEVLGDALAMNCDQSNDKLKTELPDFAVVNVSATL